MTRSLCRLAASSLIAMAAPSVAQAPQMSRAEAAQLYAAGGFPISPDGKNPTNRCGAPANPKITLVDMNGDKRREALFVDAGACYKPDGRWYAVAAQDAAGNWRGILSGVGTVQATGTLANGWFVLNTTSGGKTQTVTYNGQSYGARAGVAATPTPGAAAPPRASTPATAPAPAATATKPAAAATKPAPAAQTPTAQAPAARDAAIFRAAGFKQTRRGWESGCDDPSVGSVYDPGQIEQVKDINGDGRPEAIVIEGGSYCYGNTGQSFWLVSQQADGSWRLVFNMLGIAELLKTKGAGGWPDISIGGPGFCFPVWRYNGKAYALNRHEYEGKACRRPAL